MVVRATVKMAMAGQDPPYDLQDNYAFPPTTDPPPPTNNPPPKKPKN